MGSKGPASRGQKRAAKIKARQRRQQTPVGRTPSVPSGVLDDFSVWLHDGEMAEHADRVVGLLRTTLSQMLKANPDFSVTSWTPNDAHFLVDAVERIEDSDAENGAAAATNIVLTVLEFLTFLDETDAWTGSDDDFSHCMEDLTDFIDNDPDVLDPEDIELPDVSVEDESAALLALPLVAGVDALVERVGSGVAVSDVPELSAALDDLDSHDAGPADITALDHWAVAFASDILAVDGSDVTRGPSIEGFRSRQTDSLRDLLTHHIRHQLTLSEEDVSMGLANTFAVQTLLAAMTDDLPLDNADEDYEGLEDEDLRTAQLIDYRVRSLQEQGILTRNGDSLEVPAALRRAVLAGVELAEPFGDEDPSEAS
ncbi:hypothetical protein [Rhodococcoides kyotonense]|uniref:Uncharacterized protein n=1 Tax=Rhodococcoides kyotonense TaxID=398843 RepID=A0A239IGV5_9NOCA|nr:hypothetical protein [Rhodococcus kyotonensis]SNS92759.1 hypothetical protein SAMN05421642_10752 [Rhodococcus kyotonensis]